MKAVKIGIMSLITLFFGLNLYAQVYGWPWAAQSSGTGYANGYSIATDGFGNSYVTGSFSGTEAFGSTTLITYNSWDIFVAKADVNGNWLWAKQAGGSGWNFGLGISVDSAGNCYVTGECPSNAIFGTISLTGNDGQVAFIAKLDNNGNWLWVQQTIGVDCRGSSIALDGNDNIYVTGSYYDNNSFGNTTLLSIGSQDIFVAKLDSSGNWIWAKQAGGSNYDHCYGIAVGSNGNIFITGYIVDSANFGNITLTCCGETDIFVAKLSSNGDWIWAKHGGGLDGDRGYDIAVDSLGNSYVTGCFFGSASFGNITLTGNGSREVFIAKLDNNGNWLWVNHPVDTFDGCGKGIAVDDFGNSYVTGCFSGNGSFGSSTLFNAGIHDIFIAKLDSSGNWLWADRAGGAGYDEGNDIACDNYGDSFTTGFYSDNAIFGGTTLINEGYDAVFIAKHASASMQVLSPNGGEVWSKWQEFSVYWNPPNFFSLINIWFSCDGGVSWVPLNYVPVDSSLGHFRSFSPVPPEILTEQCLIRLVTAAYPVVVLDESDSFFALVSETNTPLAQLHILSPDEPNMKLQTGRAYEINWDIWLPNSVNYVDLAISDDWGLDWYPLAFHIPAYQTTYTIEIPFTKSNSCYLRISDSYDPNRYDWSNNNFSVCALFLTQPNGYEVWEYNSQRIISWNSQFVSRVKIQYSPDLGNTWITIVEDLDASLGCYNWTTPNLTSSQCLVRIGEVGYDEIFAVSEVPFSIISDPVAPLADFIANILSGLEPLAVQFTDLSTPGTGGITAWHWDFGDGGTSSEQNPLYTYYDPGVYSVSLTVEGLFGLEETELKTDYITVIPSVPEIELLSATAFNFGVVYLGDVSPAQTIEVKNTGGAALNIESVSFTAGTSAFSLIDTALPIVLQTDESAVLNVVFTPTTSGAVSDSIYIHSDAVNLPVLAIGLRGTGQYVPPAAVAPPTVQIVGNDAIISWEAVTETIYGSPITPDGYIVLYNETPYEDANYYYFLNFVPTTSYTHPYVALFREAMFYRVVAVNFYRESEREAVAGLRSGERIIWKDLKDMMQGLRSSSSQ